ncbi:MAG: Peptidyl-tRNA hydrolase [Chlamydiia bacterium]|nr:Peptidyl-tRNA hydrolase [Chlamydiia bacterium]MCH9615127.1 Peptidyl-tRNA hydrolase [Chlamydiia bacterium]MCH9628551.1 Peptidyl-tRNA hydrolase [Chlamydiia bacterium]
MKKLIVGLGNPGKQYEDTRHNLGSIILRAFAEKHSLRFKRSGPVKGDLAGGIIDDSSVQLLLPMTYMNLSGESVKKCADYYKIGPEHILVLSDDVNLPFGKLRFRDEGGTGGHNGLKSIEGCLKTSKYPRLKIGIGDRSHGDLSDHVLGQFSKEELNELPQVIDEGIAVLETWLGDNKQHDKG